jgi:hypothetical protein
MDGASITQDVLVLKGDFESLRSAFKETGANRATVLRMAAAKAEHVAMVWRQMADGLDQGWLR